MGRDLILLTITLDPTTDRSEALAKYAAIWKADGASWHFLTGSPETIKDITGRFGVVSSIDEGTITRIPLHATVASSIAVEIWRQISKEAGLRVSNGGNLVEAELNRASGQPETERAGLSAGNLAIQSPSRDPR